MSSNTNIGNTPVNQGYVQLIHTGETGGIDGTLRTLYDGDGTASDLQIASNKVKVSTELYIGSKTATEFIQDIVGGMFTTGSYTNITTTYDDTNGNIDLNATGAVSGITGGTGIDATGSGNITIAIDSTVATKTYVDTEVAGLVDSAPGTLDTLNELAAALGDDPNFATTTATNIATKLAKASNLSDLTNAATARTNLGVDAAGTDNSTDVTLVTTSHDYLSLSGQAITLGTIDISDDTNLVGGTGITLTGDTLSTTDSEIVHDNLNGYVVNEHKDHSAININTAAGSGLTGGGDITTTRSLSIDVNNLDAQVPALELADKVAIYDNSATETNVATLTQLKAIVNTDTNTNQLTTFDVSGDSGTDQTISHGNTLTISGGNGISTSTSATDILSVALGGFSSLTSQSSPDEQDLIVIEEAIGGAIKKVQVGALTSGISFNGSTANGLLTYGSSTTADVESNLTFDGGVLSIDNDDVNEGGQINLLPGTGHTSTYHIDNFYGHLRFFSSDTAGEQMALTSDGNLSILTGTKFSLDGRGGHTYIQESSDDILDVFVGNTRLMQFREEAVDKVRLPDNIRLGIGNADDLQLYHDESHSYIDINNGNLYFRDDADNNILIVYREGGGIQLAEGDLKIPAGSILYLDGGGDTFIREVSDDNLTIAVGGINLLDLGEGATDYVRVRDNTYLGAGSSLDMYMRHDGTNSFLENGTGNLTIRNLADDKDIILQSDNGSGGVTDYITLDGSSTDLLLTPPGNVGIGTSSPQRKLHVSTGDTSIAARFENTTSNGSVAEFISSGDSRTLTIQTDHIYSNGSLFFGLGNYTNTYRGADHRFQYGTGNTEAMRINSSGNVLIGGTSASGHGFNLEVLNDHAYVKGPDGWNGTGDKAIVALGSGVSNESFGCGYVYGTGLVLSTYKLSGGGDFGSSTQNSLVITDTVGQAKFINDVVAFATSDKRLKENIKPLDNALNKIKKINGVEFDWIDGKDEHGNSVHGNEGHDIGVIAQEIEEVLPEVVHTRDNGYKAVKYEKIVPLLIEAIKELKTEIEELKNG